MKHPFLPFLFLLVCTAQISCTSAQSRQKTADDAALRNEIGQMLVVGFRGTKPDNNNHIVRDIQQHNIGGVILFEYDAPSRSRPRNITSPQQLKALCSWLKKLSGNTLLIGIDQEGGYVSRLKAKYGFPEFASAQKTASYGNDSVRHYARLTATTLHEMGINLNFAPCVDVNTNPSCPVIGKIERSFSSDENQVARFAAIWLDEQRRQGVVSCLKHFPGHGSSDSDTHLGIADVSDSWSDKELIPYRSLIDRCNVEMIMTTHVFNAKLDSLWPATLSYATLTTLLRDSLDFKGIIITDDLAMGAMTKHYSYDSLIGMAINAGADMLCLSNNGDTYNPEVVPQTIELIYSMVQNGLIPRERIAESARRIKKLKQDIARRSTTETNSRQKKEK